MDFTGRYLIPASPETVWAGLNDPEILRGCIPGCEQIDKTSPTEFVAAATLKIGPVKATFRGKVTLADLNPPRRCTLRGEGQGGVAGFAKGDAEVLLTPEGDHTVLTYTAKASVGGKLAQIGQRLIDGAARQIADDFFARFAAALTPVTTELVPDPMTPPPTITVESVAAKRERLGPELWVVGLIGVVVILLVVFGLVL
jgi:carbon monoxide dehydrogenase subunit G